MTNWRAALTSAAVTGMDRAPQVIRDFHHLGRAKGSFPPKVIRRMVVNGPTEVCWLGGRHPVSGNFALSATVRKNQAEYSAAGGGGALAANVNEASMLLYNIGRDPQTKARPVRAFRRIERLVDMFSGF